MSLKIKCPICGSNLPIPHKKVIEEVHPWVILPFYKYENCVTKVEAMISECPNDCGFIYCEILRVVK